MECYTIPKFSTYNTTDEQESRHIYQDSEKKKLKAKWHNTWAKEIFHSLQKITFIFLLST